MAVSSGVYRPRPFPLAYNRGSTSEKQLQVFLHPHRSFGCLLGIPESNVRPWPRPSAALGFGVSKPVFLHPHRSFGFLLPESNVRHWQPQPAGPPRPSAAVGFGVLCFSIPTVGFAVFLTF